MNRNNEIADWNSYSKSFQSVMPSEMLALNKEASSWLFGDVADFGCGGGKIVPFALDQNRLQSYTGIDMSIEMVGRARWMAAQFSSKPCEIIHGRIESVDLPPKDSAVSLNSYYTWPDPVVVLQHIHRQLRKNAAFVLATINPKIDMPGLLREAEKELIAHPYWHEFKQHNLSICENTGVNFVELDGLVDQVRSVGFRLLEAHTRLYGGGLNFLVLERE